MKENQESETISRKKSNRAGVYAVIAVVIIVILVLAVGAVAGWFSPKGSTGSSTCKGYTAKNLKGAGSTFVFPLMTTWSGQYSLGTINYQGIGSGAGIQQITQKTIDFGASDAPLTTAQRAAAPGLLTFPETAGAVAIIYNLPGVAKIQLTGAVVAQIYLGLITNWNTTAITSINPGVTIPNTPFMVVHRSDGSGTTFAFTDFLSKDSSQWASQVGKGTAVNWPVGTGAQGSSNMAGTVQKFAGAIGYVDLTYALNNAIQFAKVQNPTGNYILPSINDTLAAVKDAGINLPAGNGDWANVSLINAPGAGDYPVSTFSYLLVYQNTNTYGSYDLNQAENLVTWLNWTIHQGQTYSATLYYVPLPANVIALDQTSLSSVTFNNNPVPTCG